MKRRRYFVDMTMMVKMTWRKGCQSLSWHVLLSDYGRNDTTHFQKCSSNFSSESKKVCAFFVSRKSWFIGGIQIIIKSLYRGCGNWDTEKRRFIFDPSNIISKLHSRFLVPRWLNGISFDLQISAGFSSLRDFQIVWRMFGIASYGHDRYWHAQIW
jgi:hypothetical protein